MKKTVLFTLALISTLLINAQPGKVTAQLPKLSPHLVVFNQAIISGDLVTAISSLNYFIAEQKGNTTYCDTLAMLYMQQGAFPQCFYWADRRLALKPDDNSLMEMKAICLDKLQQPKESIDLFEKLFKKTQSPYHAYKLMELQYGIKRLEECLATANAAEKLQFKPEMTMTYTVGEQMGRTYLQAGIFNIHGLALYDLNKKPEAKTYFEKAVSMDSNFVLAKQNLEAVKATLNPPAEKKVNTPTGGIPPVANKQN